ncbi:hypothetical protein [Leptospira noguchii]|uniref:Uncharacterized protein n=2 Tax=Leptospira noguchii TaxID=28182 RepID=M6YE71_9LEPT|nr:hypothetical protein LEP1GSC035_2312 [Leptospira noguchii str. 2007001578]EMO90151.1 hypothetical protein LEP1GSC024_3876 [Leptospira noguchii str. 2001034031]
MSNKNLKQGPAPKFQSTSSLIRERNMKRLGDIAASQGKSCFNPLPL